jgi:hypothetical protein
MNNIRSTGAASMVPSTSTGNAQQRTSAGKVCPSAVHLGQRFTTTSSLQDAMCIDNTQHTHMGFLRAPLANQLVVDHRCNLSLADSMHRATNSTVSELSWGCVGSQRLRQPRGGLEKICVCL